MQLANHIQAIQAELATTSNLGDEATAQAAQRLSDTLGATLHLHLLDLLGEAAMEIGGQLETGRVEIRLAGRDPELVVVLDEAPRSDALDLLEENTGRISLRLPESLKSAVEAAATREGISTNAWLVRSIARTLDRDAGKRGGRHRLQGYAQG